jgi:hypothetical protein
MDKRHAIPRHLEEAEEAKAHASGAPASAAAPDAPSALASAAAPDAPSALAALAALILLFPFLALFIPLFFLHSPLFAQKAAPGPGRRLAA